MTTKEALAVAESVQFGDEEAEGAAAKRRKSPHRIMRLTGENMPYDQHPQKARQLENANENARNRRGKRKERKAHVTINHAGNVHFSETAQFAEATKARFDAAERSAMRRAIVRANIHPAIKKALLKHSGAVQFSDSGDEVPSVPMTWVLAAARGILQVGSPPA